MKPQRLLSFGVASLLMQCGLATSQAQNTEGLEKQIRDTDALLQQIRNQPQPSPETPASTPVAKPAESGAALASDAPASPGSAVDSPTYTVQKGDNIWSLARRFKISQETIKKANGLDGESPVILIGQKLTLPGASLPEGSAQAANPAAADAPPEVATRSYVVQEGDTIAGLAFRFSVSTRELERLNRLSDPDSIRAGQILHIPGKSVPSPSTGAGITAAPKATLVPQPDSIAAAGQSGNEEPPEPPQPAMQSGSEPDPEAVQESFPVFEPYLGEQSEEGKAAPEPETSEDIPSEEPPAVESDPLPAETTAQTPPPHQSNDDEASPASPVLDAAALPDTPPRPSSIDPQVGGSETVIPEHRVPGFGLYIVRKNDTVPSVAERHSLSVDALVDLNRHLESGSRLVPGEVLRVAPGNLLLLPEDAPVPADTGTTASVES